MWYWSVSYPRSRSWHPSWLLTDCGAGGRRALLVWGPPAPAGAAARATAGSPLTRPTSRKVLCLAACLSACGAVLRAAAGLHVSPPHARTAAAPPPDARRMKLSRWRSPRPCHSARTRPLVCLCRPLHCWCFVSEFSTALHSCAHIHCSTVGSDETLTKITGKLLPP